MIVVDLSSPLIIFLLSFSFTLGGVYFLYSKEISATFKLFKMLFYAKRHSHLYSNKYFSFIDIFEKNVKNHPHRVQIQEAETGKCITLKDMDDLANQVSHWAILNGITTFDTIALMLLNCPEYISIWLGIGKIGASSALLNTNSTGETLIHGCNVALSDSKSKYLIVDSNLKQNIASDLERLKNNGINVIFFDDLLVELSKQSTDTVSKAHRKKISERDPLIYIFTSGTTGLPKACKISQTRYYLGGLPIRVMCNMCERDRIYVTLPLYHSAAGIMATGSAILSGSRIILRKKFSASKFSTDCQKYGVSVVQYIGELARYLVMAPENPIDKQLRIKAAFGNGLKTDYWMKFKTRYNISSIVEFYGATEGNVVLFNCHGKVGALGYIPPLINFLYPVQIIKVDPEDPSVPLRDKNGFCVKCEAGEVGLVINRIPNEKGSVMSRYEGYSDSKATNSKILTHVFSPNDTFFNTGDLLRKDQYGFFFWSDRTGDTFRWKGENVATTEVGKVIGDIDGVEDVAVYGVEIPNCEGRAGMAAIVPKDKNMKESALHDFLSLIFKNCSVNLPVYSRPIFIRLKLSGPIKTTSTYKHLKTELIKEGYDLSLVDHRDLLYYIDMKEKKYTELNQDKLELIKSGAIRF